MEPIELAAGVIRGERAAIGRALSLVEDRRPRSAPAIVELLSTLRHQPRAGTGVTELVDAVDGILEHLVDSGELSKRRNDGVCAWTERALLRRVGEVGLEALGGRVAVRRQIGDRAGAGESGLSIAMDLESEAIRAIGRAAR